MYSGTLYSCVFLLLLWTVFMTGGIAYLHKFYLDSLLLLLILSSSFFLGPIALGALLIIISL